MRQHGNLRKTLSLLVAICMIAGLIPLYGWAGLANPTEADVVIAQAEAPYALRFPDIVKLQDGTLLLGYYKNSTHAPGGPSQPFGVIEFVRSTDNGKTWGEPVEMLSADKLTALGVCTEEEPVEARDPNFALLNDGTILFTFFTRQYDTDSLVKAYLMESTDNGETWSTPAVISTTLLDTWCAKRGNIAVFPDDEILVPLYGTGSTLDGQQTATVIRGVRQDGVWQWSDEVVLAQSGGGVTFNEVSLVNLGGDDLVYALAREPGTVWKSTDRGGSWTEIGSEGMLHQPGFAVVDDTRVFCTWTRVPGGPRPVYGKMFYPELGWDVTEQQLIYQYTGSGDGDMGDPSAVLTADGRILTVYYVCGLRSILGTFSDPEDWEPDEFRQDDRLSLYESDFETAETGVPFQDDFFTNGTGAGASLQAVEESGGTLLRFESTYSDGYKVAQMVSKSAIAGPYTAAFDFRFSAGATDKDDNEALIALQHNSSPLLLIHLRPDSLALKTNEGRVLLTADKELTPGEWYQFKAVRMDGALFVKVWEKGAAEPEGWDMVYSGIEPTVEAHPFRIAYYTGAADTGTFDVDNLSLSQHIRLRLNASELERAEVSPAYQLLQEPAPGSGLPIEWRSSDETVATVEDGLVQFLAPGKTVITATLGTAERQCAITVTQAPTELTPRGDVWKFFTTGFDDAEDGVAYRGADFTFSQQNGGGTATGVEEDGEKYVRMHALKPAATYLLPILTTKQQMSGDYSAQFDFRFHAKSPEGLGDQELYIYPQGSSFIIHLRQNEILFKLGGAETGVQMDKDFTPGAWYTLRLARVNGGIYVKTWPQGQAEPERWELLYQNSALNRSQTALQFKYLSPAADGQDIDLDNLILSKRVELTLEQTTLSGTVGNRPMRLDATVVPDITSDFPVAALQWTVTGDAAVADNTGLISFLQAGKATATVRLGEIERSCEITVHSRSSGGDGGTVYVTKAMEAKLKGNLQNYINGYPDETFRPDALVTKGEMAQMLYNLLEVQNSAPKHGYSDVKGSWADTAVGTLCALGILPDGTGVFGLDQPATRAEFVKALAVILEIQPDSAAEGFTDTDGHALAGTFAAFRKRGILKGYPDGTARPEGTLSRAEMVTMINRGIARAASAEPTGFRDVPRDHWASGEIRAAAGK